MLDFGGAVVIILHELLDRQGAPAASITEKTGDAFLLVEMHLIALAGADKVQFVADAPQVIIGIFKGALLAFGDHPLDHHIFEIFGLVLDLGNPDRRMQVAQAPLALLYIGLKQINRAAVLFPTLVILLQFVADELLGVFAQHRRQHFLLVAGVQGAVAGQKP